MASSSFYIAFRYIRSNLKQALLIMLAVGLGVSIIIFIPSVNSTFLNQMLDQWVASTPNIRVLPKESTFDQEKQNLSGYLQRNPALDPSVVMNHTEKRTDQTLRSYESLLEQLKSFDGVVSVTPMLDRNALATKGNRQFSVEVKGTDIATIRGVTNIHTKLIEGKLEDLLGSKAIIGWRLADELGIDVGDYMTLVTSQGRKTVQIVGLYATGSYWEDRTKVYVPLSQAQSMMGLPQQVTSIGLKTQSLDEAPLIAKKLSTALGVKTRDWIEETAEVQNQRKNFITIISFINFLILAAAASSITSMLIMTVSNKTREIGILKAMGMKPSAISRIFIWQALLLSLLGIGAGILGGHGFIAAYNATPMATATYMGIERKPAKVAWDFVGLAVFYAALTSFLAGLIPAWQAGKLDPVQAMQRS
jgi:lipoprotein-releasing system permease protein